MQSNRHYAKTLFELSKNSNCSSLVHGQLKSLEYLFNKVPFFRMILITKRLGNQDKINIVKNSLTMFEPIVVEFLSIIINKNQINHLLNIIQSFYRLDNASSDIKEVEIITANKIDENTQQTLIQSICDKLNTDQKINIINDPSIIGGTQLRVGNKIFDNSISYQINQLKKTLHNL